MITMTPTKAKFYDGVAFAKKMGCAFDSARKVWYRKDDSNIWSFVDSCKRTDESRAQYLRRNGLQIISSETDAAAVAESAAIEARINGTKPANGAQAHQTRLNPATTYMGQASMDAADSIF